MMGNRSESGRRRAPGCGLRPASVSKRESRGVLAGREHMLRLAVAAQSRPRAGRGRGRGRSVGVSL